MSIRSTFGTLFKTPQNIKSQTFFNHSHICTENKVVLYSYLQKKHYCNTACNIWKTLFDMTVFDTFISFVQQHYEYILD